MATTLQVTDRLRISSLVDMRQSAFQRAYQDGLVSSLFKEQEAERGPLHDLYLADIFTLACRFGYFEAHCEQHLAIHVDFALGDIHGGCFCLMAPSGKG